MSNKKQPTEQEAIKNIDDWIRIHNAQDKKGNPIYSAESEDDAVIEIDGPIGEDFWGESENTTKAIRNKLKAIAGLKAKKIRVLINSLGGQVNHGIGIHDVLATHNAEIITDVIGMTASAATVIAQAGDTRKMSANALYLIHQPWSIFINNVTELEDSLEQLKKVNDTMLRVYVKRSGQPESKIRELMNESNGNGKWIDAEEAKELGLIDEIYEPMKAAASIKDQIERLTNGPEELLNRLPEIPNSKIKMKTEVTKKTDGSEAAMEVSENEKKGLTAIITAARKFFGPSEEEQEEKAKAEKAKADKAEAEKAEAEKAEAEKAAEAAEKAEADKTDPDKTENVKTDPDKAKDESPEAIAKTEARMKELETENAELKSNLAKATAASTKIDGPEGQEGSGNVRSAEEEMLAADLAKLRATWNGEE